jgi:polysaccharide deacetylase family sporulation protein PdaB
MPRAFFKTINIHKPSFFQTALIVALVAAVALNSRPAADMVFNTYAVNAAQKKKLPIYSVDTTEKKVALTFDAAWGADDTDTLLGILSENDIKATFFLCGYWVTKHPDYVKKIHEAGHDIGNHGNTHAHGAQLSKEQNKAEIQGAHDKVKSLLGIDINLFRPPFGEYNNTVIEAAEELNYYPIQWDIDSHDWMNKGVDYELDRVLNNKNLQNGSIILFHNDAKYTPQCLAAIIKGLKDKGYGFVPLSELIYKDNYYMDHTGRQKVNQGV